MHFSGSFGAVDACAVFWPVFENKCSFARRGGHRPFRLTSRRLVRPTSGDARLLVVDHLFGQAYGVDFVGQVVRRGQFDQHGVVEVTEFLEPDSGVTDEPGHGPLGRGQFVGHAGFARDRFPLVGRQSVVAKRTTTTKKKLVATVAITGGGREIIVQLFEFRKQR